MLGVQFVDQSQQGLQAVFRAHHAGVPAHGVAQPLEIGRGQDRWHRRDVRVGGVRCEVCDFRDGGLTRAFTEGGRLEQAVRRQAIGAMHTGRSAFADGVEALQRGAAGRIGGDAAHVVVRGGGDRHQLGARIDAIGHARGEDGREFLVEMGADGGACIQEGPPFFIAPILVGLVDGAGDDIARRQFAVRMVVEDEAAAVPGNQRGAFAAQGFGGQRRRVLAEIERGWVELDEFRIGDDRTGQRRHGHAFAAQVCRVGGHREQAARTTRGQDGDGGIDLDGLAIVFDQGANDGAFVGRNQAQRMGAFPDLDRRGFQRGRDDGFEDLLAGQVAADAGDAGQGMGGFAVKHEGPVGLVVERRADGIEVMDGPGSERGQGRRGGFVNDTGAGIDGIDSMGLRAIGR